MRACSPWVLLLAVGCSGAVDGPAPSRTTAPAPGRATPPSPTGDRAPADDKVPPPPVTIGGAPVFDPGACRTAPARLWKLTPDQYTKSAQALGVSGHPGDELLPTIAVRTGPFSNEASVTELSEPHVAQVVETAQKMASTLAAEPKKLLPCLGTTAGVADPACLKTFVEAFGQKAFRRELTADESSALVAFARAEAAAADARTGLEQVISAILVSPSFLFRTELGPEGRPTGKPFTLTGAERAAALSYFLTDGPPDPELTMAARMGQLETSEQIGIQTRRLLKSADAAPGVTKMLAEEYRFDKVKEARKDDKAFPDWSSKLAGDMATETASFVKDWLWQGGGKLPDLFTRTDSAVTPRLATWYGLTGVDPKASGAVKVKLPPQRAGILTQGAMMAALARDDDTAPVQRGKFVRELILCQDLPPPPPNVNAVPPPPDGQHTQRERLLKHSMDRTCAGCHSLMDPLGLAFESYDGVGRYRTMDVGKPIDASGVLTNARPEGAPFANAVELEQRLATSPDVSSCFVRTVFRYAYGRVDEAADGCTVAALQKRFDESGGDVLDLLLAVTTDPAFFTRTDSL